MLTLCISGPATPSSPSQHIHPRNETACHKAAHPSSLSPRHVGLPSTSAPVTSGSRNAVLTASSKRASRLRCNASLATYDLLASKTRSATWLERCARAIVSNIDSSPFLLVVHSSWDNRYEIVPVEEELLAQPQVWGQVMSELSESNPEAIVLVHRVGSLEDICLVNRGRKKTQQFSDSPAACDAPPTSSDLAHGKVGSCCPPETPGDFLEADGSQPLRHQQARMYGLAVQSVQLPEVNGCFVLKTTVSSDSSGCQCTHFSLTKVCKGESLPVQLQRSWLVTAGV